MSRKTANLISVAIILAAAIASAIAYPGLAEQVPSHWNAAGEVDGYSSRLTAALFGPVGALAMMLLMWVIPVISPKGFRTGEFAPVVHIFQVAIVAFMAGIGGLILLAGHGVEVSMNYVIPLAVGALFIVLGNYMGRLRKNFFIGIRTPWTLASDEVWARTHRLGGYLFVIAGVGMMLSTFVGMHIFAITTLALVAGLLPVVYSFVLYRRIEGFDNEAT